jgi:hypothetical protein
MGCVSCGSSSGVKKDSNCCGEGENIFTSDIKFDGTKFTCGTDVYARECDSLNDILATMFGTMCGLSREVLYAVDALSASAGNNPAAVMPNTTYTVPINGSGTFEVWYMVNGVLPLSGGTSAELKINVRKNGTAISAATERVAKNVSATDDLSVNMSLLVSEIICADGDVIAVYGYRVGGATFNNGVIKIIKKAI